MAIIAPAAPTVMQARRIAWRARACIVEVPAQ
jgi:hypothetical protein